MTPAPLGDVDVEGLSDDEQRIIDEIEEKERRGEAVDPDAYRSPADLAIDRLLSSLRALVNRLLGRSEG